MTVGMALVDYIPVLMFLVSAIVLQRGLYNKMSKGAFALFSAGTIMVFCAGFFKATWKLLFAAGVCDFEKLSLCFLPMQATGFFLLAIAMIAMLCFKQGNTMMAAAAAPAVFSGTMIFVSMMCLGIGVLCTALSIIAAKLKKKALIGVFALAFIGMLGMGYLSSKDFAEPAMNWIAEATNVFGQGMLLWGALSLKKAGLDSFQF